MQIRNSRSEPGSSRFPLYHSLLAHRILPAWIFWAAAMMSNAVVGVLLQHHVNINRIAQGPVLYDLGFEILPYIPTKSYGFSLPDFCALASATVTAVNLVVTFPPHMSMILLRRILLIAGVAYLGRAISVPMTLLPNPDPDCTPVLNRDSMLTSIILIPFGLTNTCSDCFYSGHAIPISCALFTWYDYMRRNKLRPLGIGISIVALLTIIATHFHYTIDVFYGFMVTAIVWRSYHFALSCPSVLYHFPSLLWWEINDAMGHHRDFPTGVIKMNWSIDPRILWSYRDPKDIYVRKQEGLSRSQITLLLLVALTLSPSWIAIYQGIII
jgi:hypothetical protein